MASQRAHVSHWREDGTCSYCGSLSPEQFFAAIEAGAELGPTDKNYKVYVHRAHPLVGRPCIDGGANFPQTGAGWVQVSAETRPTLPAIDPQGRPASVLKDGEWVHVGACSATTHDKFYFQHLSEDERKRFVELMNAKTLSIGYPGHFYRLPFFVVRPAAIQNSGALRG